MQAAAGLDYLGEWPWDKGSRPLRIVEGALIDIRNFRNFLAGQRLYLLPCSWKQMEENDAYDASNLAHNHLQSLSRMGHSAPEIVHFGCCWMQANAVIKNLTLRFVNVSNVTFKASHLNEIFPYP